MRDSVGSNILLTSECTFLGLDSDSGPAHKQTELTQNEWNEDRLLYRYRKQSSSSLSPLSGRVNRLNYWSRRKKEEKNLSKWITRGANMPCIIQRKLVRKADDRNFTYRVYYKGERCGESETVLCRRRITKKAAGAAQL